MIIFYQIGYQSFNFNKENEFFNFCDNEVKENQENETNDNTPSKK